MNHAEIQQFRHRLVQSEFRSALNPGEIAYSLDTEVVMVLSGPTAAENLARIAKGIEVTRIITAKRLDHQGPRLVLNGETEQLPAMIELAKQLSFPEKLVFTLDCGPLGNGNTKTNFTAFQQDPQYSLVRSLIVVTSDYHVPRVQRTAQANLAHSIRFQVVPTCYSPQNLDVFRTIRGEIKRIEAYSARGDIAYNLPDRPSPNEH